MATVLIVRGWRLFFYSNERSEPPHIHAKKSGMDCKFWLFPDRYDIEEVYGYGLTPAERRALRRIIFEHFDYLLGNYLDNVTFPLAYAGRLAPVERCPEPVEG